MLLYTNDKSKRRKEAGRKAADAAREQERTLSMALVERAQMDHVVAESATAEIIGVSKATLRRMVERGEGPRRLKLSARRVGYRMSDLAGWLNSRGEIAGSQT